MALLTVIVALLLIAVGMYIFRDIDSNSGCEECHYSSNKKLTYYYNPGCYYCKRFSPLWDEFVKSSSGEANFETVNCSQSPQLCGGLAGVPTVVSVNGSQRTVFNGAHNLTSLKQFLKQS